MKGREGGRKRERKGEEEEVKRIDLSLIWNATHSVSWKCSEEDWTHALEQG